MHSSFSPLSTKQAADHVLESGSLGFGEEYMAGNIQVEGDFKQLLRFGSDAAFLNLPLGLKTKLAINTSARHRSTRSHVLQNMLPIIMIVGTTSTSCGLTRAWRTPAHTFVNENDTLEQAQQQKYEHICRKLQLKPGEALVDIGCGWGGMLIYAAKHYGVRGVGCSLSKQQVEYAPIW